MQNPFYIFIILLSVSGLMSCETDQSPKPKAYPRVHYPVGQEMQTYSPDNCPYSFQIPSYFRIEKKDQYFDEDVSNECWANVVCDSLNGTVYLSYKELNPNTTLMQLMEEAYTLTYKHTNKADYIQPREIDNGHGTVGLVYYVGGEAASNIQFFVTDTTSHFVRGALYFYTRPNTDSLQPVVEFMIADIEDMINSWRWK
jgi:gliding motility-associated lipoprotein GldD